MVELQSPVPNDEVFGMQRLAVQPRGGSGGGEEERGGQDRRIIQYNSRGEFSNIHCLPEDKLQKCTP